MNAERFVVDTNVLIHRGVESLRRAASSRGHDHAVAPRAVSRLLHAPARIPCC